VRAGRIWQGRCQTTLSVTVPGLLDSPGVIPIVLDADESFPVVPPTDDSHDAGAVDADNGGFGGGTIGIDAASDLAVDSPVPCDVEISPVDATGTPVPPASKQTGGGCGCSLGQSPRPAGALVFFLLAFAIRRARRS
jgi:MYXO-CTERM domain-containing protein